MKMKSFVLLFFAAFAFNSCSVKNCDVLCNSGPLSLHFELLDKATGENLFTNNTFDPNDIEVSDLDDNNSSVPFTFNDENDINIITLGPFGWGTNIANYRLKIDTLSIFRLYVNAEEKKENCCSFVQLNKLEITEVDSRQNTESGVYEILVEL